MERHWVKPAYLPFWKTEQAQPELVAAIESGRFPKDERIIDLGCGSGETSRWLARRGYDVLGIDYSRAAIGHCRLST